MFFYQRGVLVGVLGSAAIFTVYHFAVYGSNPTTLRAQRVTSSIIAHILNNLLAVA